MRYLTILLLLFKTWMDVTRWVTHQSTEMCLSWRLWSMAPCPCWKFCNIFHNICGSFPSMSPHGFAIFCSYSSKILWLFSKKCPYQCHILNDNVNWIFKGINFYVEIETTFFKIKGNQEEINFQSLVLAFPQLHTQSAN